MSEKEPTTPHEIDNSTQPKKFLDEKEAFKDLPIVPTETIKILREQLGLSQTISDEDAKKANEDRETRHAEKLRNADPYQ
ncbi:MAG: hypothetical protein UR27_C0007G0015 [Candidatus Peregrinibacteria bacterium GW2011_GWA2_33_10]|nr:MAG: hypothetical protein UR27_C0007G0015 [Candidatus Peregrinibacteria bacterium GW2011_GWA2_33_10]KKP40924.1 MAG: hypothetical protein UR30_C0003G0096 [Candidatus Peregrinibacteria bacterium GW2011_GWC2_33_13]